MIRNLVTLAAACLLITAASHGNSHAGAAETQEERDMLTLDNAALSIRYDVRSGTFTARRGDRLFITEGRLVEPDAGQGAVAKVIAVGDALGTGRAIEVTWPDGRIRRLALYESLPLICVKGSLRNPNSEPMVIKEITPLRATTDAGVPVEALQGFGPVGLYPIGDKTNFCFAAAADPHTRAGIVCGWLSHSRGSGVVTLRKQGESLAVAGHCQYGRLLVPPGGTAEGETLAIGYFDDALAGLEAYADGCAKAHQVKLPERPPSGYCTWYHAGAANQQRTAELAEFCGRNLRQFGFDFVQIDDGWQVGGRDFTGHNPRGRYSQGMKSTAEKITDDGLVAGIWYIPFGWDPKCPALADHADWFVQRPDGSIYSVHWAGSCLDMTHPQARDFLRRVAARISREWGYKYIKVDGLWSGMATKILYPSPAYREDELGTAVLHDPAKTQIEAYRAGLQLVRQAAGREVFILGCNIAQNVRTLGASFGLVDGMRIGHDIGARWGSIRGCALPTSHFYFFHGKVWFNDPDCLMLRDPLTLDQARAWGSLIALSGQMNVVSEWLPGLPPERLDIVKRTMPNHGGLGRPVDLFENNLPTIWHYQGKLGEQRVDLVGLFNWDEKRPAEIELDPARLGLPASTDNRYVGFDFWEKAFVGPFSGKRTFALRPSSCRVIALHRSLPRPQLVGTSRHVTQGAIDVSDVTWLEPQRTGASAARDAQHARLRGRSQVVGGDPYELRIFAPQDGAARFQAAEASACWRDPKRNVRVTLKQEGPEVRATIHSPDSRTLDWSVAFPKPD